MTSLQSRSSIFEMHRKSPILLSKSKWVWGKTTTAVYEIKSNEDRTRLLAQPMRIYVGRGGLVLCGELFTLPLQRRCAVLFLGVGFCQLSYSSRRKRTCASFSSVRNWLQCMLLIFFLVLQHSRRNVLLVYATESAC